MFEPISAAAVRKPGVALRTNVRSTEGCSIATAPGVFEWTAPPSEQLTGWLEAFGRVGVVILEAFAAAVRQLAEAFGGCLPGPRAEVGDPCGDGPSP